MKIVLNPAPARKIPQGLLENVDVLTPNQVEAFGLLGKEYPADLTLEGIERLGRELLELGPAEIYLTLGGRGAIYLNSQGKSVYQPPLKVQAIDTVGAGDAFNAALCVALAGDLAPEEALFRACVSGALTTTKIGVINALPTAAEVEGFIAAYKKTKDKPDEDLLSRWQESCRGLQRAYH